MRRRITAFIASLMFVSAVSANDGQRFFSISYHDIGESAHQISKSGNPTISFGELMAQFAWLDSHGFKPVSLSQIVAARNGGKPLPDKAVLLTFDDGYVSTYTRVFPLLKTFGFPAVVAIIGQWMEVPEGQTVKYGDTAIEREYFLNWEQIREMQRSGLVEVASHSYDLHHAIAANPQGNRQPAATTRRYDPQAERYETDEEYRQRIRQDLERSAALIEAHTGQRPRALVWPYGAYSHETIAIAREAGMPITMTLDEGDNSVHRLGNIKRIMLGEDAELGDLVWLLNHADQLPSGPQTQRVAHVDLDYVFDPDPRQQEKNLGQLLDRIKALKISTVYLQAFADPDGDGNAEALYFPNRHMPMREDLFNRVAWQLRTRSGVEVYAWMPVLAFELNEEKYPALTWVEKAPGGTRDSGSYRRLSPFSPANKTIIAELYEDLAKHAMFDGLLFHDDAYLTDHEDASEAALGFYAQEWNLPPSIGAIRESDETRGRWMRRKTASLSTFTVELAARARHYRPHLRTARNLYARVVLEPHAQEWFGQSLENFAATYDHIAVMAMPLMEGAADPDDWLRRLVAAVKEVPGAMEKTVFELQAVDWRKNQPVASGTLARQMALLKRAGATSFGYYPDDFIKGHPAVQIIRPEISLNTYPYSR